MNSFISWVGAKTKLASYIVSKFSSHKGYTEIFGGGASILFHKKVSKAEIYNDVNRELTNLFIVVRDKSEELNRLINWSLSNREIFDSYRSMNGTDISQLAPVERAFRYYYLIKNAFGSNPMGSFSSCRTAPIRWNPLVELAPYRDRLAKVTIENLHFDDLVKKYDCEDMLFYADPPYYVAEGKKYYEFDFGEKDHLMLFNRLKDIKGKFVVSYDDVPEVRELYKDFLITLTDPITYTLSKGDNISKKELLIFNYEPPKDGQRELIL